MSSPLDLEPGLVFAGDFRIAHRLALGAAGAVYVADQVSSGARRALKVMQADLARDEGARALFEREARVGAHIESDHVVLVVGAGVDRDTSMPWVAMELLEGVDLGKRVAENGPMPPAEVAILLAQACDALGKAHEVGIVHGDVKPANVFLAKSRRPDAPFEVKMLDFGVAKLTVEESVASAGASGTPLWMAPEQASSSPGGTVGPSTDVWALGLVAFHALTGKSYWVAGNAAEPDVTALLAEIQREPLEAASARAARVGAAALPAGFDAWFARCVARDAAARFPNAAEAYAALAGGSGEVSKREAAPANAPGEGAAAQPSWMAATSEAPEDAAQWFGPKPAPLASRPQPPPPHSPVAAVLERRPTRKRRKTDVRYVVVITAVAAVGIGVPVATVMYLRSAPAVPASASGSAMARSVAPPVVSSAPPPVDSAAAAAQAALEIQSRSPLVDLAGGDFTIGSPAGAADERPPTRVKIAPFSIDRREVGAADYATCVAVGVCTPASSGSLCAVGSVERTRNPANCVNWKQATAYCAWLGRRLPTEAEWEYAAGGRSKRPYPSAKTYAPPSPADACWQRCKTSAGPCDVGSFPAGDTPEGIADMAGNVREWTASAYCSYATPDCAADTRVTRGGGWCDADPALLRTAAREPAEPTEASPNIGFRCAR